MAKFQEVRAEVDKMEFRSGNLADRLDDILDRARINADDTCYVDKSEPAAAWDAVALASLEFLLSCEKDSELCDWFESRGVTW